MRKKCEIHFCAFVFSIILPMWKNENKLYFMGKTLIKGLFAIALFVIVMFAGSTDIYAAGTQIDPKFDYRYYADTYPDLKEAFGYNKKALWKHYVNNGRAEGRKCCPEDAGAAVAAGKRTETANVTDKHVLDMSNQLNAYRASKGLQPLELSQKCNDVAKLRAKEIATSFSHKRPNGTDFAAAYTELGYTIQGVGENIGMVYSDALDVNASIAGSIGLFKGSSGHDENMLGATWKCAGFGYYVDGNTIYIVQEFSAN